MTHKQHRPAFIGADALHFADALFLELGIAHGQYFVHN
jgi:hypothetical protein